VANEKTEEWQIGYTEAILVKSVNKLKNKQLLNNGGLSA